MPWKAPTIPSVETYEQALNKVVAQKAKVDVLAPDDPQCFNEEALLATMIQNADLLRLATFMSKDEQDR